MTFGEALKAVRHPQPRVWAVDAVRVDVRARHGKRAHGPLDQEGKPLDAVAPLLLAANNRLPRDVESLSRVELARLVRLCLFVQHLHRALEGEAAVDVQLEVQQRHARDRVLLHLAREVGRDLDRLAADVDDAVVELAVLLGDAHLLLQDGHEVVENLVLHLDAHAEQPVEEALDAPLVVGVDADRGDRLLGVVQVLLPPRVQLVVRLEPERTAHVRRRRPGRREERVAEQLDELVVRLLAPLGVDVEHREVRRVGSAPIPLGDGAELLQPLGHRRRKAALAAAGRHEQLVLRPVDLVGAMRAAALLDALVGGPRQLERDVQPLARVRHAPVRLQRDARRGRLRDDGDELAAVHEGLLLREVDALHRHHPPRVGVHLVRVPLLVDGAPLLVAHEPPLATRELGDRLGAAELLDELVERVVGHLERVQLAHELLLEPLQHLDLGRVAVLRPAEVLLLLLRLGQQVVVRSVALAPLGLGLRRRLGRRRQRRL
mmetsp:Transcript_42007/g.139291  ORF Transcript_42007/g.139291 Transcript_42007/m.139291 type:complete len:490 (-) Transcript_42007:694-2163(-)